MALLLITGCFIYNYFVNKSEPLLRVVVRNPGALIFAGKAEYYEILQNGHKKKIDNTYSKLKHLQNPIAPSNGFNNVRR